MATVFKPKSLAARKIRIAISDRFAAISFVKFRGSVAEFEPGNWSTAIGKLNTGFASGLRRAQRAPSADPFPGSTGKKLEVVRPLVADRGRENTFRRRVSRNL